MSIPNLQSIYRAAYSRAATDSAGSTLRAALGGASSVITVAQLRQSLPAVPLLAFAGMDMQSSVEDADDLPFGWYVYDSPLYGFWNINGVVSLLRALYPHDWLSPYYTRLAPSPKEQPDYPTNLNVRPVFFAVSARQ